MKSILLLSVSPIFLALSYVAYPTVEAGFPEGYTIEEHWEDEKFFRDYLLLQEKYVALEKENRSLKLLVESCEDYQYMHIAWNWYFREKAGTLPKNHWKGTQYTSATDFLQKENIPFP